MWYPRGRGAGIRRTIRRLSHRLFVRSTCRRLCGPELLVAMDLLDQSADRRSRDVGVPERAAPGVVARAPRQAEARYHRHAFALRRDFGLVAGSRMGRHHLRLGLVSDLGPRQLRKLSFSPADPSGAAGPRSATPTAGFHELEVRG